jgi:RNA polymerase sigma factor (sigma-70 family)
VTFDEILSCLVERVTVLETSDRERVQYFDFDLLAQPRVVGWIPVTVAASTETGATYHTYDRPRGRLIRVVLTAKLAPRPSSTAQVEVPPAPAPAISPELAEALEKSIAAGTRTADCVLRNLHDAEDSAQDGTLKVLRLAPRDVKNPGAYVADAQRNAAIDAARLRDRRAAMERSVEEPAALPSGPRDPDADDLERELVATRLLPALRRLSPKAREVIVLVNLAKLSREDAALLLHSTEGAIQKLAKRTTDQLLQKLDDLVPAHWRNKLPRSAS